MTDIESDPLVADPSLNTAQVESVLRPSYDGLGFLERVGPMVLGALVTYIVVSLGLGTWLLLTLHSVSGSNNQVLKRQQIELTKLKDEGRALEGQSTSLNLLLSTILGQQQANAAQQQAATAYINSLDALINAICTATNCNAKPIKSAPTTTTTRPNQGTAPSTTSTTTSPPTTTTTRPPPPPTTTTTTRPCRARVLGVCV